MCLLTHKMLEKDHLLPLLSCYNYRQMCVPKSQSELPPQVTSYWGWLSTITSRVTNVYHC